MQDVSLATTPLILYLHGFLSSPQSAKAKQTQAYCENSSIGTSIIIPEMKLGPADTVAQLKDIIRANKHRKIMLMGSSLGGFYACHLAEEYGYPAALINPAVRPFDFWETHIGEHKYYYSDETHIVTEKHLEELREIDKPKPLKPENYLILVQTGDETLDYRQAVEKFAQSRCIVRQNGNHSFENYSSELPTIFEFLLSRIA